jgi:hypothetical protein
MAIEQSIICCQVYCIIDARPLSVLLPTPQIFALGLANRCYVASGQDIAIEDGRDD